jgi:maltose O-acetyltransferase
LPHEVYGKSSELLRLSTCELLTVDLPSLKKTKGYEMKSEKEKMLAGDLYNAADPELIAERRRARILIDHLNNSSTDEYGLREQILHELIGNLGAEVYIEPPFFCDYGYNINLNNNVYLNFNCIILDVSPVTIGRNTLIGPGVHIYTATHPLDVATRSQGLEFSKSVQIGNDVWIGGGAIICPGTSIGDGSVIGAGSVVTRNIPAGVFAAGNPCRVVRNL